MFTRRASGRIAARNAASTMPSVEPEDGTARTTTWLSPSRSGTESGWTSASAGSSPVAGERRTPVTWAPKARARTATSWPIEPNPMINHRVEAISTNSWTSHRRSAAAARQRSARWRWSRAARRTKSAMGGPAMWEAVSLTPRRTRSPNMGWSKPAADDWSQRRLWDLVTRPKKGRAGPPFTTSLVIHAISGVASRGSSTWSVPSTCTVPSCRRASQRTSGGAAASSRVRWRSRALASR